MSQTHATIKGCWSTFLMLRPHTQSSALAPYPDFGVLAGLKYLLTLFACVLAQSCGSPVIHEEYHGEPLLRVSGSFAATDLLEGPHKLRTSIFWSPSGQLTLDQLDKMHEDSSVHVQVEFPTNFQASIYKPPLEAWMVPGKGYATGAIFVYEDTLGLGRYVHGVTPIRGGSPDTVLFYSPHKIPRESSPFQTAIGPGLVHLSLPLPCGNVAFPEDSSNSGSSCGNFRVGEACARDDECGSGATCLQQWENLQLPNGYCSAKVPSNCSHKGSVALVTLEDLGDSETSSILHLFKACEDDSSCRTREGYGCDPFARACLPAPPTLIEFSESFKVEPFCISIDESVGTEFPDSDG